MIDKSIDTSPNACAMACMIVSNPQGSMRKDGDGWQKRVNDLIRTLAAERDAAQAEIARLTAALEEIALWDIEWPEKDPMYGPMAVVTARKALRPLPTPSADVIRDAVLAERERCACVAFSFVGCGEPAASIRAHTITVAIRAALERSKPPKENE